MTGKFNCPSCDIAGGRWSHALGCDRGTGRTASGTLSALGYPGYGEDFAAAVLAACEEGMSPAFAIECELGYRRSRRELTAGGAFGSFAVDGEES